MCVCVCVCVYVYVLCVYVCVCVCVCVHACAQRGHLPLCIAIRELIPRTLEEIISQEESPEWVLHTSAHLHQVTEDVPTRTLFRFDVHHPHGNQQVPGGV